MVSVSRRAGLAATRAIDVRPGRMAVERVAGPVEGDVLGQDDRQLLRRHRHDAAILAMDDRDRTAPVALARDAPVAQAEIDAALGDRPAAPRLALEPARHLLLGLVDAHAVEEARVDQAAVAVIGGVGDREGRRIGAGRAYHRRVAEAVFVDEVEVALVMRRAAEDGAGAVIHEDEIGDIDRQRPVRVERMHGADAGVVAQLLGRLDRLRGRAGAPALLDEGGERRIPRGGGAGERMVGRQRHEAGAEQRVGARRVDVELALARRRGAGSSAKRTRSPSERPIQFFCISRTFSGQRSSRSSASSRSCA